MAVGRCKHHTACRWGFQCMRVSHLSHASPPPRVRAARHRTCPRPPVSPPSPRVTPFPRPPRACLAATLGDGCRAVQATTQRAAGTCMRVSHLSHASPPPRVRAAEPPHPPPAPRQPSEPPGDTVPRPPRACLAATPVMAVGRCKLPHSVPLGLPVHEEYRTSHTRAHHRVSALPSHRTRPRPPSALRAPG